jgi:anti-sigma regulatory factor (Ser/Thr protein kinase)
MCGLRSPAIGNKAGMLQERVGPARAGYAHLTRRARPAGSSVAQPAVVAWHVPATVEIVPDLRRIVVAFAARFTADSEVLGDIARAVSEALANVVLHAYDSDMHGLVHVIADVEEGAIEVIVADGGLGFRAGESAGSGLGLTLVAASSSRFEVNQLAPSGTEIWMRFELGV